MLKELLSIVRLLQRLFISGSKHKLLKEDHQRAAEQAMLRWYCIRKTLFKSGLWTLSPRWTLIFLYFICCLLCNKPANTNLSFKSFTLLFYHRGSRLVSAFIVKAKLPISSMLTMFWLLCFRNKQDSYTLKNQMHTSVLCGSVLTCVNMLVKAISVCHQASSICNLHDMYASSSSLVAALFWRQLLLDNYMFSWFENQIRLMRTYFHRQGWNKKLYAKTTMILFCLDCCYFHVCWLYLLYGELYIHLEHVLIPELHSRQRHVLFF